MTPSEIFVNWTINAIGCPYIYGDRGQSCTPEHRRAVAKSKPSWASKIKLNCPVLSGKKLNCLGCKWGRRPAYDCRGLTAKAVEIATGRPIMGQDVTGQWTREDNWVEKGLIQDMPDKPCVLFKKKLLRFSHTGNFVGWDQVIHASGHSEGVIRSAMPYTFTHYAIPVGLYKKDTTADKFRAFSKQLTAIADELEGIKMLYQAKINTKYAAGLGLYKTMNKLGGKVRDIVRGEVVNVLVEVNADWAKCEYKGFIGYIDRQYLGAKIPPVTPPKPVPTAIIASIRKLGADAVAIAVELEAIK
ncbi:MAG: hypothetical protein WC356_03360 [Candidatus Micrarchaeia archaeon]|jgi:hypothetical protein